MAQSISLRWSHCRRICRQITYSAAGLAQASAHPPVVRALSPTLSMKPGQTGAGIKDNRNTPSRRRYECGMRPTISLGSPWPSKAPCCAKCKTV